MAGVDLTQIKGLGSVIRAPFCHRHIHLPARPLSPEMAQKRSDGLHQVVKGPKPFCLQRR